MVDNERVELPYDWRVIADKLDIKGYDRTLLACHFDGIYNLYNVLAMVDTGMTTDWHKVTDKTRSSRYRIHQGKLEYTRCNGKVIAPKVRKRSKNDTKHRNYYLVLGTSYMHRLAAQTVYNELGINVDGYKVHHRLIDETATIKGNSLGYLVVLTDEEHSRLHYLLNAIIDYVEDYISGQINLFDIVD